MRLLIIMVMFGVRAHAQSIRPDDIVASAIARFYEDAQKVPDFVCDMKELGVTYGPEGRSIFSAGTYEWLVASGKLYRWSIDDRDGSRMKAFPPINWKDVPLFSPAVPFKELPTLFRVRSMRQSEFNKRSVWEITLKARPNIEWPRRFARYHGAQLWVDQQDERILKLVYTGTGQHDEFVFSMNHPGFLAETHAESVGGSILHRTRSTVDHSYVYKAFGVSTRIAAP